MPSRVARSGPRAGDRGRSLRGRAAGLSASSEGVVMRDGCGVGDLAYGCCGTPVDRLGERQFGDALEQDAKSDGGMESSEGCAEAVVWPDGEREVRVGVAVGVEPVGLI